MKENNDDSNPVLPFMKTTDKTDFENRGRRAGTTLNFSNTLNKNNNIINQNIEYSADISNGNVSKNKVYKQNAIATQIMNQSDTANKSRIPGIKFKGERPRTPESKIKVDKTMVDKTRTERPKTAINNTDNNRFNFNSALQDQVNNLMTTSSNAQKKEYLQHSQNTIYQSQNTN
jgi:hypothetical protein